MRSTKALGLQGFIKMAISLALVAVTVLVGANADLIPDRVCATLHSEAKFAGNSFQLKDFDQSVNLNREYRHSLKGEYWGKTGSFKVQKDCNLILCNETYFVGSCSSFTADKPDNKQAALSANCTCKRECDCKNVMVPEHDSYYGEYGRAYVNGDCTTCNSEYLSLVEEDWFPDAYRKNVSAFVIRRGCKLALYAEPDYTSEQESITDTVRLGYNQPVGSYRFTCSEEPATPATTGSLGRIDVPVSKEALLELLMSNATLSKHEGLSKFSRPSAEKGRSPKNVHVVLIGYYKPHVIGFTQCHNCPKDQIGECRVTFDLSNVDMTVGLRVITAPLGANNNLTEDYELLASLDEYLTAHEELGSAIPNAVIIYHWIGDKELTEDAAGAFQRKLEAVRALRARLLDEKHSNLIFLFFILPGQSTKDERQPEARISIFEAEVRKWTFPSPLRFVVRSTKQAHNRHVNGFMKMKNGEYWPRNLEVGVKDICDKAGDTLGELVLRQAFQDKQSIRSRVDSIFHYTPLDIHEIDQFYTNTTSLPNATMGRTFHLNNKLDESDDMDNEESLECFKTENKLNEDLKEINDEIELEQTEGLKDEQSVKAQVMKQMRTVQIASTDAKGNANENKVH